MKLSVRAINKNEVLVVSNKSRFIFEIKKLAMDQQFKQSRGVCIEPHGSF